MWFNFNNNDEYIITSLEDAIWYLNHEELIETKEQIKDIERIFDGQSYRVSNKKYYIEKIDRIRRKFYTRG